MTGLCHFPARQYGSGLGRFASRDALSQEGNLYLYALGNPLAHRDPTGLLCEPEDQVLAQWDTEGELGAQLERLSKMVPGDGVDDMMIIDAIRQILEKLWKLRHPTTLIPGRGSAIVPGVLPIPPEERERMETESEKAAAQRRLLGLDLSPEPVRHDPTEELIEGIRQTMRDYPPRRVPGTAAELEALLKSRRWDSEGMALLRAFLKEANKRYYRESAQTDPDDYTSHHFLGLEWSAFGQSISEQWQSVGDTLAAPYRMHLGLSAIPEDAYSKSAFGQAKGTAVEWPTKVAWGLGAGAAVSALALGVGEWAGIHFGDRFVGNLQAHLAHSAGPHQYPHIQANVRRWLFAKGDPWRWGLRVPKPVVGAAKALSRVLWYEIL